MPEVPDLRVPHQPHLIAGLRAASAENPWRVLFSGCLLGQPCGVDGSDYGMGGALRELLALPTLKAIPFCPEDHSLGTPRGIPDIHGGDGFDVLDGRAQVRDQFGEDLSLAMIAGARAMLQRAQEAEVELAILTDMSGACGSQVISEGCRLDTPRRYRRGVGVAAALLLRHGIPVLSQRDRRSLGRLRALLEHGYRPDPAALDHHQHPWVVENLGTS